MKLKIYRFLILQFLIFISFNELTINNLFAQNKYDLEQFFREGGDLFQKPLKWDLGDWLKVGGLAAGSVALMYFDNDIKTEIQKDRSYNKSIPLEFGRIYGEPYSSLAIGFYFLVQGANSNNIKNKKLGFEILESFAYTGIITSVAKVAFGRKRPFCSDTAFDFNPFSTIIDDDFLSFFSGHTSVAFSMSTIIAANVEGTGWKILSYAPAFITGFSRVYQNKHWTSDVLMGAAVGYFIGRFVINTHEGKDNYMEGNLIPPQPLISFTIPLK